MLDSLYQDSLKQASDIYEHLPTLRAYAERVESILEIGVRDGHSTVALLSGKPRRMTSIDIETQPRVRMIQDAVHWWDYQEVNSLQFDSSDGFEMLFIDSYHTYTHLTAELASHGRHASRYLVFHDTATFGRRGEDGSTPGLLAAIAEYLETDPGWTSAYATTKNNGLWILEREDNV